MSKEIYWCKYHHGFTIPDKYYNCVSCGAAIDVSASASPSQSLADMIKEHQRHLNDEDYSESESYSESPSWSESLSISASASASASPPKPSTVWR